MKKLLLPSLLCFLVLFSGCRPEESFVIVADSFEFNLLNFTNKSYQSATLSIGAKDENGDFIPTESIKYNSVPSNDSPSGVYTYLDNCAITCGNDGLINGYHYYFSKGEHFVDIPFSSNNDHWSPDLSLISAISSEFMFVLEFSNGDILEIPGLDLNELARYSPISLNISVLMEITDKGLQGRIRI